MSLFPPPCIPGGRGLWWITTSIGTAVPDRQSFAREFGVVPDPFRPFARLRRWLLLTGPRPAVALVAFAGIYRWNRASASGLAPEGEARQQA
jgi:hypothetical protein